MWTLASLRLWFAALQVAEYHQGSITAVRFVSDTSTEVMSVDVNGYVLLLRRLCCLVGLLRLIVLACLSPHRSRMNILSFSKFLRWGVDCRTILDGGKTGQVVAVSKLTPGWLQLVTSQAASSSSFSLNTPMQGLGQVAAAGTLLGIASRNTTYVIASLPDARVRELAVGTHATGPCACVWVCCVMDGVTPVL